MPVPETDPVPPSLPVPPSIKEETGFDEAYLSFARTLRTWFVAYGIGVPVLFLNQASLLDRLLRSGQALVVARCFLAGVLVQIGTAIVYKAAMWHLYRAEYHAEIKDMLLFPFFEWVSDAYWLEFLLDAMTLALFTIGTVKTLSVLF